MSDYRTINFWLKKQGSNLSGEPLWRLVFSDNQREIRKGTFNEFSSGGLFLRTFQGHKEVPKYPYIHERWILERWCSPETTFHIDLPETSRGSYEPVFVFEDRNGRSLPLSLRAVELVVRFAERPRETSKEIECRLRTEDESRDKRELLALADAIDTSDVQSLLHSGEAITNLWGKEKYGGS